MAEVLDHPYSLIQASWAVSTVYLRRGDVQNALPLLERAAQLCRLRDIPRQLFPSTVFLGFAYALARRSEEAVLHLEQAEALREAWGATATWTHWLAEGFWLVGRFEDAARIAGRALTQSRENSERGNQAWLLRLCGELDGQSDPPALIKAESHYQQALAVATELGIALDVVYSRRKGLLDAPAAECILRLLEALGFDLFANELLNVDSDGALMILKGLEEFREHLGGDLTITLLHDIGRGFEVHEMSFAHIVESIYELQDRHTRRSRKVIPAAG